MRRSEGQPSYLVEAEASHLHGQALPGAIVLQLRREIPSEQRAGQPQRRMFIELSVSEAVQHWQAMGDLIRRAGALAGNGTADAATNL